MTYDARLIELGIELPPPALPVASYIPTVQVGALLFVSGQVGFENGQVMAGRVGDVRDLDYAIRAARACGLMIVSQIKAHVGSLDRVDRFVKLGAFVNSVPTFTDQPKAANGASDLIHEIFGEAGRHTRSAVGVSSLPFGATIEIDAVVAIV